jgi:hypothetical protein
MYTSTIEFLKWKNNINRPTAWCKQTPENCLAKTDNATELFDIK